MADCKFLLPLLACVFSAAWATHEDTELHYAYNGSLGFRHTDDVIISIIIQGSLGNASGMLEKAYNTSGHEYEFSIESPDLGRIEKITIAFRNKMADMTGTLTLHNMTLSSREGEVRVYSIGQEVTLQDNVTMIEINPEEYTHLIKDGEEVTAAYHVTIRAVTIDFSMDPRSLELVMMGTKSQAAFVLDLINVTTQEDVYIPYVLTHRDLGNIEKIIVRPFINITVKQVLVTDPRNMTLSFLPYTEACTGCLLQERLYRVEVETEGGFPAISLDLEVKGSLYNLTARVAGLSDPGTFWKVDVESFVIGRVQDLKVKVCFGGNFFRPVFLTQVRVAPYQWGTVDESKTVVFQFSSPLTVNNPTAVASPASGPDYI